jgi:dTDP-4-dehydrorhamnose reductase
MKVTILGHNGMLGSMAAEYFGEQHVVSCLLERLTEENCHEFIEHILDTDPDVIINALGQIKQKYDNVHEMKFVNGEFPNRLATKLHKDMVLVHPSTDCVFSGKVGNYGLADTPDPSDAYGESKLQAESMLNDRTLIVRTSIIGLEKHTKRSLLSWFLDQHGTVNGFTNWYWSGVTTLVWCQSIERLLASKTRGLHHLATERISKHDLLVIVKDVFHHDVTISSCLSPNNIDRSLRDSCLQVPDIKTQLIQFASYEYHQ